MLIACTFSYSALIGNPQENFFSDPKLYSKEELAEELKQKKLDMCWHFGKDSHFRFVSGDGEVYFELYLGVLPEIYSDFIAQVEPKFIRDKEQLIFSYKITPGQVEEMNVPQPSPQRGHPDQYSYIVADRRVVENASPGQMSPEELVKVIRDKRILFYTGAGLSLASGVPAMNELTALLGLEAGEKFLFSLGSALENPREFASKIRMFHQACFFSAPTQAHFVLKDLAVFKNSRIVTENLDSLHEASGICPYRIDPDHLRNDVGGAALRQFDYIICVGLSYDDRGFLGWYKQQNPHGKIVAVDLKQPSYLGDEDYLVVGDIQEVFSHFDDRSCDGARLEKRNDLTCHLVGVE